MTICTPRTDLPFVSLFNRAAFHALNAAPGDAILALPYDEGGRTVGVLSGVLHEGAFTAGFSSPCSGPDFARPRETPAHVEAAIDHWLAELGGLRAERLTFRCPPASWSPTGALVQFGLLNRGFTVAEADLNHAVDLSRFPTADAYLAALRSPARRALRHALGAPFAFAEHQDLTTGYALVHANRRDRGRALSLSREYFERVRDALPAAVRCFVLEHEGAPCAAALVMVVAADRWYVQAWGDAGHRLERSPMNLLAFRVIERALAEGVRVLDLGRTTEPGGPPLRVSHGLAQFKQSILATAELRPVLVR
ncbi:GNAT family N-acetyltransferase [Capillimicrobium parvum]|uniref:BioF2-like acetyltransferase domain-containing protein n=1 Tax=Capillimicrobium parvum TaxID=2884022 RepID=A0A9E6XS38_9ACTN|nr:GNAT family N-acetyltransferase [Capillimicrobium parvum]UGS33768.1 hypothetical protein DSM104329_00133 [Capillimicrobium parvum]